MGLFLKRSKGSITVLVTLILIPTIFFTGFLVDLARLKLYGNQAVMTADNYGETVLTQYDNLLKELYGLFAVTQDEEALKQLEKLQEYVQSSFTPASATVSWNHLEEVQQLLGTVSYEGFMPYQSAEVALNHEFVENANLRNHEVFSTQVGDFMKFRIAQQLIGDGNDILEAVSSVQNMENNAKAIDKKLEIDKKVEKIYEAAQEYYKVLKDFTKYPDYITDINKAYSDCKTLFLQIIGSSSYQIYRDYEDSDKDAMNSALEKRERIKNAEEDAEDEETEDDEEGAAAPAPAETISEAEQQLLDIYDAYMADTNARRDKLADRFNEGIRGIEDSTDAEPIDFESYTDKLSGLKKYAEEIQRKAGDLETLRDQLKALLTAEDITTELKDGLQADLDRMEKLFSQVELYTDIAAFIDNNNTSVNSAYKQQTNDIVEAMKGVREAYLEGETGDTDWPEILDRDQWKKFDSNPDYKTLYESLDKCFGNESEEEEGKKKKKAAEDLLEQAKGDLKEDENTTARDIPANFGYGGSYRGGFDIGDLVGEAVECFSANNFKNELNKLLLKLYTVEYDLGMFSSRVTNIDSGEEEQEKAVSLTGYEMSASLNYLYGAELEYLLGGSNSSKENLNAARDKILAIRAVVNYTATYSVKEVNDAIQAISDAAAAVNPILGLAVNGALRLAVAGVETAMDWSELKQRKSVILIKSKTQDMTAWTKFKDLLNISSNQSTAEKRGIELNYEQYLMIMMVFLTSSDTLAERTANLVELNVNTVKQNIGSGGTLSELQFKMGEAHTAVNATCTVHLDFAIIPRGFAKLAASEEDYDSLMTFEKNSYKFTVTRGY